MTKIFSLSIEKAENQQIVIHAEIKPNSKKVLEPVMVILMQKISPTDANAAKKEQSSQTSPAS